MFLPHLIFPLLFVTLCKVVPNFSWLPESSLHRDWFPYAFLFWAETFFYDFWYPHKRKFPPLCQLLFLASFDCKIQIFFCHKNIHLYPKLERTFEVRKEEMEKEAYEEIVVESEKQWKWLSVSNLSTRDDR